MRILVGDRWEGGYLDPWKAPGERRIEVRRWVIVAELDALFFEHRFDVRRLLDYGREVGPIEVARKVMSRLSERDRNDKVAACGLGVDCESAENVVFFAPFASRCMERVTLPAALVWPASEVPEGLELATRLDETLARWSGWVRESEIALAELDVLEAKVRATVDCAPDRTLERTSSPIVERCGEIVEGQRLKAVVFGYGHYVRSVLLPSLPPDIEVVCVHEIDPTMAPDGFPAVDTCPTFRDDEHPDVTFVAGFHHSHAPLAAEALRRNSFVVSEKPLATTQRQLADLLAEWVEPSRYFASFQRRFMAVNQWAMEDLDPSISDPLSYHALVHEVSLPTGHWYNWRASGSRLLSNGCHWVDHFLYLNDFAAVQEQRARRGPNGEIVTELVLDNGAFFTLTLTDRGSDRLGVREHTELRVRDRTAVIEDMSSYRCEGPRGVIRQERFHRLAAHHDMYAEFARRILAGAPGEARRAVERTAQVVLDLEAELR